MRGNGVTTLHLSRATVAAALGWFMLACSGPRSAPVQRAASAGPVGPGLVIRTTDGTMQLGLERDTVFMGLSDSVVAATRKDMAVDTEEHSSIGRAFEGIVKKTVSRALNSRVTYPVEDIDSAKYENGAISFTYRQRRRLTFEEASVNGHKMLSSFAPGDAQRFVVAVDSAIRVDRGASQ